jgi:hypothetical protein
VWKTLAFVILAAAPVSGTPIFYSGDRVSIVLPRGWHVTSQRVNGVLDPVTIFTATSFRLRRPRPSAGLCSRTLQRQWRTDGAYVQLTEERDGASRARMLRRVPPRPHHFDLRARGAGGLCTPPDSGEIPFRESGRAFYLFFGIGTNATSSTRRALHRLVDSIRITPRR